MTDWEEALVIELRRSLALALDDIVEAMRRCINPGLSRSAIHRCLQRHGISARLTRQKAPAAAFHTDAPAGFIHLDVKYLPPLDRRRSYAYVAIDRATRFVDLEILPDRRAITAAGFLEHFLDRFPLAVHTVLTDNGSEFTDRFAVDKKLKPHDKPSGQHAFDRICTRHRITHRLIRPFHPQTNGMVERFNRRLGEHLDRRPQLRAHRCFRDHAERDAYLHTFVADYNRTRLRCLGYQAPAELLANLTGHNTKAGGTRWDQVLFVLVAYRLPAPGGEWRRHREWFERTALADLLGEDFRLAESHKLYRCHDRLLEDNAAVFTHLTARWRDLFNVSYDVLLYDLTSPPAFAGAGLYGELVVKPDDAHCVFSRCRVSVLAKTQCRTIRGELASGRERSRYTLVFGRSAWTSTMMQSCASAAKLRDGRPIL